MLKIVLIIFLNVAAGFLFAQEKNVTTGNQQWLHYYNQIKLNEKWALHTDMGYRWKDVFEESTQYIVRTGLAYSINSNTSVSTGIAHLGFYSGGKLNQIEFRPYQEFVIKNTFNKIVITHRYRIEERFFNPVVNGSIQTPNTFNFRFRYAAMISVPLFGLSKTNPDTKFLLNFGDEVFINAGRGIVHTIFDQNRIIISPSFQLSKKMTVSLTWSRQYASTATRASFKRTNITWLQVRHTLDFAHLKEKNESH